MVMRKYRYYTIYKITNLINGKIYIGAHQTDDLDDGYMGSGKLMKYAIKKYGVEKFEKEYLFDNLGSMEVMYDKEAELVNEVFIKRADTYNIVLGGRGNKGNRNISQQTISKNSIASKKMWEDPDYRKKITEGNKGKTQSDEARRKISEAIRKKWEDRSGEYFKKHLGREVSDELRKKISDSNIGKNKGKLASEETKGKLKKIINSRTLEEKKRISKKLSEAGRKAWLTRKRKSNNG